MFDRPVYELTLQKDGVTTAESGIPSTPNRTNEFIAFRFTREIDHELLTYRFGSRDFRLADIHGKVLHIQFG